MHIHGVSTNSFYVLSTSFLRKRYYEIEECINCIFSVPTASNINTFMHCKNALLGFLP